MAEATYRLRDWIALFTGAEKDVFDLLQKHMNLDDQQAFDFVMALKALVQQETMT